MFAGGASEYGLTTIGDPGMAPGLDATLGLLEIPQSTLVTGAFLGAGLLVLLTPLVVRWLRKLPRTPLAPPSVQSRTESLSRLARDRESLEALMKEVRDLTKLCAQQIDSRVERLEKLLAQADERLGRLEAGVRRESPLVETRHATPSRAVKPSARPQSGAASAPEFLPDPVARQVYELADQGRTPVEIAGSLEEHVGKVELILALRGV